MFQSDGSLCRHLFKGDARRPLKRRCYAARGDWCGQYERQPRVPFKVAPRGNKDCVGGCNDVGVCDYDMGICQCPAGKEQRGQAGFSL